MTPPKKISNRKGSGMDPLQEIGGGGRDPDKKIKHNGARGGGTNHNKTYKKPLAKEASPLLFILQQ